MAAFALCLALFAFWAAVGYALLAVVPPVAGPRQRVLLAPALGAAVVIVPVFWLNRAGLPVESFATALLVIVAITAIGVLAWKRPRMPWRRMIPFIALLPVALLLAAWPMVIYGFDWASYSNADMAHYSLGASRLLHAGFFTPSDQDAILRGTDFPLYNAYQYILTSGRAGSELMLAAIWAATGLDAHLISMPVTFSLHLALVWAAAAMVAGPGSTRNAPILVALLMAISPLTTLGALIQLIAQVGGLAFFCASVVLLYRVPRRAPLRSVLAASVPAVFAMAALVIWYTEILPFLGIGWFAYFAMTARKSGRARVLFAHAALAALLMIALLNAYFLGALKFTFAQAQYAMGQAALNAPNAPVLRSADVAASAFPYFLIPSGMPIFWGIMPIPGLDAYMTAAIIGGALLSIWFLAGVWPSVKRASPSAAVFLVMAALAAVLFRGQKDFALFKLALYMQPFVLALMGERLAMPAGTRSRAMAYVLVGAASLAALLSQQAYVVRSTGEYLRGLNEVWHASAFRINSRFPEVVATLKANSPAGFTSDTSNVVQLQHQTLYSRGYSAFYPGFASYGIFEDWRYPLVVDRMPASHSIFLAGKETSFVLPKNLKEELARRWFVTIPRYETVFNMFHAGPETPDYYRVTPPEKVVDHLIFVPSKMGDHYYFFSSGVPVAFNHLEDDPMFPGRQLSGLGRDLLFMMVNPSPRPRVVMEISATVMRQFDHALPPAAIYGATRVPVGFVGHGSARVVSPPVEPTYVEGVPFIALDMGRDATRTPYEAKGLMSLYGAHINPDPRGLTAYARDISVVGEKDYAAFAPPAELSSFPRDLGNSNLEYSGIYEDGWISDESFFVLGGKPAANMFRISGMVPEIGDHAFTTAIVVRIDGGAPMTRDLKLGDFKADFALPQPRADKHRIDIRFVRTQRLPGGDGRSAPALISFMGLVAAP